MATARGKKNAGGAKRNAGRAKKNAGGGRTDAAEPRTNGAEPSAVAEADELERPHFEPVVLAPAERSDRSVESFDVALKNAEVRLKLAWKYRAILDPALPRGFHAAAWTAFDRLDASRRDRIAGAPGAASPLGELARKLSTLRAIVEDTTRPGDPARDALGFGAPIKPTRALPSEARAIVSGARSVRARFPALTDQVLQAAEDAIELADSHVTGAKRAEVDRAVRRADDADDLQIALDVLLDRLDHLRAAARATFSETRPRLADALTAPIEPRARETAAASPAQPVSPES
ncbi:hypothetical protein [Sandaracinus amylolyticus]|uniref:hypothetical protein n=1 Tax=Sandaracinus amylolyticus TaxID=927083 RepID=UPI0012ED0B45|nr:hypothetical protein [Sandaracinus amylolyticus]